MLIGANNIIGGGDSWITDTDGSPKKWELSVGNNTLSIILPSTEWSYIPFVFTADGTKGPSGEQPTISGSIMTLQVLNVTSAQRGTSGHDCWVQIRIVK